MICKVFPNTTLWDHPENLWDKKFFVPFYKWSWGFPFFQMAKNPSAMLETWVWSLGQEDPLEKAVATHSSILALIISWIEEPGRPQSVGLQRVRHSRYLYTYKWSSELEGQVTFQSYQMAGLGLETSTFYSTFIVLSILRWLIKSPPYSIPPS